MNEKEKKTLIIISSVFIFVLVFMVFFTFYRRDSMLSNRTIPKIDTNIPIQEVDPPSHGDTCSSVTRCYCDGQLISGDQCSRTIYVTKCTSGVNAPNNMCCPGGSSWDPSSNACRKSDGTTVSPTSQTRVSQTSYYNATCNTETTCTACDFGKYLNGTQCSTCPAGKYCAGGQSQPRDIKCEDYDSVAECPSTCHAWGGGCHTNPKPEDTIHCCVNGDYRPSITRTECSELGGSVVSGSSQCSSIVPATSCDPGQYLDNGVCKSCPSGYYCGGGTSVPEICPTAVYCENGFIYRCPAGTYGNSTGKTSASQCLPCDGENEYSTAGATQCSICEGKANSTHTGCVDPQSSGCSPGYFRGQNGCEKCPAGYYCPDGIKKQMCQGQYVSTEGQPACNAICSYSNGSVPNADHTGCVKNTSSNECADNQVKNGLICTTCSVIDENSEPNSSHTSCVCKTGYVKFNGKCVTSSSVSAPCCSYTPIGGIYETLSTVSQCQSAINAGKTVTNGSCPIKKCCCNLATGNCSMAASCGGSLPTEQYGVTSAAQCTSISHGYGAACYRNSDGKYVWGSYGIDDENYSNYEYTVTLDKESCLRKNEDTNNVSECVLRCPSTVLKVGQTINCTFETADGGTLGTASSNGSSASATVNTRFVEVTANSAGDISVSGTSSNGCVTNTVNISVFDDENNCKISGVYTASNLVSQDSDGYSSNSYYTAVVNVIGTGCSKEKLTVTADGRTIADGVSVSPSGGSYSFLVYPNKGCNETSTVNASLSNGSSGSASVTLTSDWSDTRDICVKAEDVSYNSFLKADIDSASEYYSNWDGDRDCYTVKWTRGCGSSPTGSGSTPTPTPPTRTNYACYANAKDLINATSTIWATSGSSSHPYLIEGKSQGECKSYACFVDSSGTNYQWANTTPSGYKKVDTIFSQSLCKNEDNACYIDGSGVYHWGKYKNNPSYTFVASISDENKCKKNDDASCYSNGSDYVWDVTPPDSTYTKVTEIDTPVKCVNEKFGCFIHENKYTWGNFFNLYDYYYVAGITEQEYCSNYGCYVKDNDYVWGDYSDDSSYKLVRDITDRYRCGVTPDVPKTDLNVQTIVYVAVAVMSVAGIYFVVRYNNKSKKI